MCNVTVWCCWYSLLIDIIIEYTKHSLYNIDGLLLPAAAVIFVQQPLQELDNFSKTVMSDNNAMATTYACLLLMPEGIVARCVWIPGY